MIKFLKIFIGFIAAIGLAFLIYIVSAKQKEVNCSGIKIRIEYPEKDVFIEENEIKQLVESQYEHIYLTSIESINTQQLEDLISKNPYVRSVNVYANIQGELIIQIQQRQPIFRVDLMNESFYVDNFGSFMPLSPKYVSRVVIVNGFLKKISPKNFKSIFETGQQVKSDLVSVYELVKYIRANPFLKALIEQIYINKNQEIELIPKLGRQYILLGNIDELDEKFNKLKLFYEQGMQVNGWDAYSVINLKFKNQVVCTKI